MAELVLTEVAGVASRSDSSPLRQLPGTVRWAWRTLTSMRTALGLLAMLALASVPGSLLPQRGVSPADVAAFVRDHPQLAPWVQRAGLFEVFSSPWFASVYLLLLVSMTGCVLPRCARLWRALRARPALPPGDLARLPEHRVWTTEEDADGLLLVAKQHLETQGFRVRAGAASLSAEKGYLREVGNLAFHLSLLVLLLGVAAGRLLGLEGRVIVVEGSGFTNTPIQYDELTRGPLQQPQSMEPFAFTLRDFSASFETDGAQRGTPRDFRADITYSETPEQQPRARTVRVNHPLVVGTTKVFLTGHGYAPRLTVRDGQGQQVASGPVVFLPLDASFASEGVVKAPDAQPTPLAFEGVLLPTAAIGPQGPVSTFPDLLRPRLLLTAFTGDLGLDAGRPQSVYTLDKSGLRQVTVDGEPLARALMIGETMTLPGGQGSITFDGVSRFANFQVARDPGKQVSLLAGLLLLGGLTTSLLVRQRRLMMRTARAANGTVTVQLAVLPRTRRGAVPGELERLAALLAPTSRRADSAHSCPTERPED